jgi:homoserine dehydrogenase
MRLTACDFAMPLYNSAAGLFGGGTVGGGVYEICEADNKAFLDSIGAEISISKICVRDASKVSNQHHVCYTMLRVICMSCSL